MEVGGWGGGGKGVERREGSRGSSLALRAERPGKGLCTSCRVNWLLLDSLLMDVFSAVGLQVQTVPVYPLLIQAQVGLGKGWGSPQPF